MKTSTLLTKLKTAAGYGLTLAITLATGNVFAYNNNSSNSIASGVTLEITDADCFFGPNSTWNISGELVIYSENVWIAPTASFTGSGKIIFKDPSERGNAAVANTVDGNNGNFIDVDIEQNNRYGIVLDDIADPEYETENPTGPLAAALKVGQDFNLTSLIDGYVGLGDVFLNGNNFVFDQDATISGYLIGRFVETGNSIAGHMVKIFDTSSGPFTFPVGFSSDYTYEPARITATSGTFYVSLQDNGASASDESVLVEGPYITRTWHIYADVPTVATVDLQHDPGVEDGGFAHDQKHIITRWLGSTAWELNPEDYGTMGVLTTDTPINAYALRTLTTTVQTVSSPLAYWTKAFLDNPSLPVILIAFSAFKENTTTLLTWKTASETNSSNFIVQRSSNAKEWNTIGEVAASGESNTEKTYSFSDNKPLAGSNYYRLKMIDTDESFAFSKIENVNFENELNAFIYPNPVSDHVTIDTKDWGNVKRVEIINPNGKVVYQSGFKPVSNVGIGQFANGIYFVSVTRNDGSVITKKIVIMK